MIESRRASPSCRSRLPVAIKVSRLDPKLFCPSVVPFSESTEIDDSELPPLMLIYHPQTMTRKLLPFLQSVLCNYIVRSCLLLQ
jgi:hypothetical protein